MSDLKADLQEAVKTAMKNQDKQRLSALRLIMAAIKQKEVDERITLDNAQVLAILDKMLKQRRESIAQYQAAKRQDLIDQETFEINIIQSFLPAPLSDADIITLIDHAIQETGATSVRDMGKVMAILKPKIQGRTDIAHVSSKVKERLP